MCFWHKAHFYAEVASGQCWSMEIWCSASSPSAPSRRQVRSWDNLYLPRECTVFC